MTLEQVYSPEPGVCRVVFRASGAELEQSAEEVRAVAMATKEEPVAGTEAGTTADEVRAVARKAAAEADKERATDPKAAAKPAIGEEDLLTAAVNRVILAGFSPLYEQAVAQQALIPVTDPDFSLLAMDRSKEFRAQAEFFVVPRELELGRCTGFVQAVRPRPIRELTLELEINRHHSAEDRAADSAGKAALRRRVAQELYQKRCAQARTLAEQTLVYQLGAEVHGPLPKQLVAGNYFAEQRRFNLSLQAQGVNFDQYLAVQGQTVEQFRQELHAQAEQRLRSRLGLLLLADRDGLWPTAEETAQALVAWDEKRDGERTFPANDARKVRQRIAAARAAAYVISHSTLTPPPKEPVIARAERGGAS